MKKKHGQYIFGLLFGSLFLTIMLSDQNYWRGWLFLDDNFGDIFNKALSSLSITSITPSFFFCLVLSLPFYLSYCLFMVLDEIETIVDALFDLSERTENYVKILLRVIFISIVPISYYFGFPLFGHYFPYF